jgi:hypothetical protein
MSNHGRQTRAKGQGAGLKSRATQSSKRPHNWHQKLRGNHTNPTTTAQAPSPQTTPTPRHCACRVCVTRVQIPYPQGLGRQGGRNMVGGGHGSVPPKTRRPKQADQPKNTSRAPSHPPCRVVTHARHAPPLGAAPPLRWRSASTWDSTGTERRPRCCLGHPHWTGGDAQPPGHAQHAWS